MGFEYQIARDDHANGLPRSDRQRRSNFELASHDLLTSVTDALLRTFADRARDVAVAVVAELGADAPEPKACFCSRRRYAHIVTLSSNRRLIEDGGVSRQLDRVRHAIQPSTEGLDLYAWTEEEPGERMPKANSIGALSDWRVVDDWPRPIPVTAGEIDVFEAWFGDVLDELFGPV